MDVSGTLLDPKLGHLCNDVLRMVKRLVNRPQVCYFAYSGWGIFDTQTSQAGPANFNEVVKTNYVKENGTMIKGPHRADYRNKTLYFYKSLAYPLASIEVGDTLVMVHGVDYEGKHYRLQIGDSSNVQAGIKSINNPVLTRAGGCEFLVIGNSTVLYDIELNRIATSKITGRTTQWGNNPYLYNESKLYTLDKRLDGLFAPLHHINITTAIFGVELIDDEMVLLYDAAYKLFTVDIRNGKELHSEDAHEWFQNLTRLD